jgi:hypothetical protein
VAAVQNLPSLVYGVVSGAGDDAEMIDARLVSGSYFSVLGVEAFLGRTFTDADDQVPGGHPVAVASHAWWERRLGADTAAVGKTITIGRTVYTIIGVAAREFFGTTVGESPDVWIPLAMEEQIPPGMRGRNNKLFQSLNLIARLKPGASIEQRASNRLMSKRTCSSSRRCRSTQARSRRPNDCGTFSRRASN